MNGRSRWPVPLTVVTSLVLALPVPAATDPAPPRTGVVRMDGPVLAGGTPPTEPPTEGFCGTCV
ncbi:hypothetical protein [Jidongwangia harbinensis]|uniref:hypothetical protein n=1 Tax=Jidongwangia harbinensis TaxID=2878561 RepID=UPI001CD98B54|nr:hypothetical protein [Jidongwangia harbinensis]MCA2217429.1 hypothetical protein [Jidongwangia harbinensis]